MDIATIAKKARVDTRKVRYVLDHGLIPALLQAGTGRGQAREFDCFQSFVIAVAATLFDAGLPKDRVAQIMRAYAGVRQKTGQGTFWSVYNHADTPEIEFKLRANVTLVALLVDLRTAFQEPTNA